MLGVRFFNTGIAPALKIPTKPLVTFLPAYHHVRDVCGHHEQAQQQTPGWFDNGFIDDNQNNERENKNDELPPSLLHKRPYWAEEKRGPREAVFNLFKCPS
jgi:hypothetical protein